MTKRAQTALLTFGMLACQPRFTSTEAEDIDPELPVADTGDTGLEEEDWSDWEGAQLIVLSPESGSLLWLGEDSGFEAQIVASDGSELDWNEVIWTSAFDSNWDGEGLAFEDDGLIAGNHDLKVETTLPTGDHLVWVVGGVRVQHPHAGTYVGNMLVDATGEYDGTELTTTCIGAAILIVDAEGESATGDSTCLISLLGFDLDASYDFDLGLDGDALDGTAALDLTFSSIDFDATGEVEDGQLDASWGDMIYGTIDMAGTLELERISYDTP